MLQSRLQSRADQTYKKRYIKSKLFEINSVTPASEHLKKLLAKNNAPEHYVVDLFMDAHYVMEFMSIDHRCNFQEAIDRLAYEEPDTEKWLQHVFPITENEKAQGFQDNYVVYKWKQNKHQYKDWVDFWGVALDTNYQRTLAYELQRLCGCSDSLLRFLNRIHQDISIGFPVSDEKEICAGYYTWFTQSKQSRPVVMSILTNETRLPPELGDVIWEYCVIPNILAMFGYFSNHLRDVLIQSYLKYSSRSANDFFTTQDSTKKKSDFTKTTN
jgi:hypothetical protein